MTPPEVAYLAMVIGALSAFSGVLAFVSWYARPRRASSTRKKDIRTPTLGPTPHAAAR